VFPFSREKHKEPGKNSLSVFATLIKREREGTRESMTKLVLFEQQQQLQH